MTRFADWRLFILSEDLRVSLKKEFTDALCVKFGYNNVKIVEKSIEKRPE